MPTSRRNEVGSGLNPKIRPIGVKGKISVRATVERVAIDRYFDGLLLKKGLSIGFRFHCSASFWGRAIDRFVRALRNVG
jgi:hypothetical protein